MGLLTGWRMSPVTTQISRGTLLKRMQELETLPTLPAVAQKVFTLASDPEVTLKDLQGVIMLDPPLTAKVMKVANSAYAGRRFPATGLESALVTIGMQELVGICTTIGLLNAFSPWVPEYFDRRYFWLHSASSAYIAQHLALSDPKLSGKSHELFLAGILHDIGWIVMDYLAPDSVKRAYIMREEIREWSSKLERRYLGMDHVEAGFLFLRFWNLPEEVVFVAMSHHEPETAGPWKRHAHLLQLAIQLAPYKHPFSILVPEEQVISVDSGQKKLLTLAQWRERESNLVEHAKKFADMITGG
ncbi:HDOD domain-containing protein [bacterium]|nr:HDOD domain-containing protein [bacterium]